MKKRILILSAVILAAIGCAGDQKKKDATSTVSDIKGEIQTRNNALIEAAMMKDFNGIADIYAEDALLLAEYNPLIDGKEGIKKFYTEIFERQSPTKYQKETTELFDFGETILEIGTFRKSFPDGENRLGPYWHIWELQADGNLLLRAETFGYFDAIKKPSTMAVDSIEEAVWNLQAREGVKIPLEYDAYGALMENIVRDRDTNKMLELYTKDGSYTPYVDTTKAGIANLSRHYYAYHKNPVVIDSIESATYDYIKVPNGVLRFTQFYVEWTVPGFSGMNQGTGMVYWKRQEDNSLKIHRQIGHHIYSKQ
ncbi:MAG: hypothetical protein WBB27_13655 [Maribacter sp.]